MYKERFRSSSSFISRGLHPILIMVICSFLLFSSSIRISIKTTYYDVSYFLLHKSPLFPFSWDLTGFSKFNPLRFDKCKMCNFTYKKGAYEPNSNDHDVIITTAITSVTNVLLFIRTLRTTGCKAQVFLLVDNRCYANINEETMEFAKECGLRIINFGIVNNLNYYNRFGLRFIAAYELLEVIRPWANRIIFCDVFDIVFQGDPFTEAQDLHPFLFTDEHININCDGSNVGWVKGVRDTWEHSWGFNRMINGGFFTGKHMYMLKFMDIFFSMFDTQNLSSIRSMDQGYFNYMNVTGLYKNMGLYHHHLHEKDIVRHLWNGPIRSNEETPFGKVCNYVNPNLPILVVHQYYRSELLGESILKVCPRMNPKLTHYHRIFSDEKVQELENKWYMNK